MMRRIAAVLAAVSTFAMLLAGVASADDKKVWAMLGDTVLGKAEWTENGDALRVCDLHADGHGVRGYIYRPKAGDQGNGTVLIKASDPKADGGCVAVSENIGETIAVAIKVCRYKGSWVGNCDWALIPR